jgi:aminopeptidase
MFEQKLQNYADLVVKVGLNLQPGQRLMINAPLEGAPLTRQIAASAYKAGARLVDVLWADEELTRIRFQHAPRDSFAEFPHWRTDGLLEAAEQGDAFLSVHVYDPDLLADQDPDLVSITMRTYDEHMLPIRNYTMRDATNWTVIAIPIPSWAARIFPDLPPEEQMSRLWETVFAVCRLNKADPVVAWQEHVKELTARSDYLNHKQYTALKYTGPGTDFTLGLPKGHIWKGAQSFSETGITFTANIPTEEVFTMPHREKAEGVISASRPLNHEGFLIESFSLTFANGRVVKATADKGEAILQKIVETDEGAARLGEVALVPYSSPISQSGLLFYNILFDENAASHLALGRAYRFNLEEGKTMSEEAFAAAGGNYSLIHIDFMIGSDQLDVDGLADDGTTEPVMRGGEWAF